LDRVVLTEQAKKDLGRIPLHVRQKFELWVKQIALMGLADVRKIPGYHDEPLKGQRHGQRSIRLSRAYRAIYRIFKQHLIQLVSVEEINKHEY
jgi:toxin HigB-1